MESTSARSRVPVPVIVLVLVALIVAGLLIAQGAMAVFNWFLQLAVIGFAFVMLALIGTFLWRRGDFRDER